MIEAVMFWNEPNNKSHWDFEIDADWSIFGSMVKLAAEAVGAERPGRLRVLGGHLSHRPGVHREHARPRGPTERGPTRSLGSIGR